MSAVEEAKKALEFAESVDAYEARALLGADVNVEAAGVKKEKAERDLDAAAEALAAAESERAEVHERAVAATAAHDQARAAYDEAVQAAGGVTVQAGVANVGVEGEDN